MPWLMCIVFAALMGFILGDYRGYGRGRRRGKWPQTEQEWKDEFAELKRKRSTDAE